MSTEPTDHPPPDDLRAYGQGLLPAAAAAVVERHLETCDACCQVLEVAPEGELLEQLRRIQLRADRPGANGLASTGDHLHPAAEVGAVVAGRYKLLQVIGDGGMGRVFMAEQTTPVKRMVALKVIRAGMDSKQVLARFDAERQALALMGHPNIAKVFDAGTTESGHPFFVMELVKGVPITQFCDERNLSIVDRLTIFQQVCSAVQHAHQKGIIHRDLKPTNILVESHDGKPIPKVIDFGLAKAINSLVLADRTLFTNFGAILGTPMYMAPEQAEFGALDIDTRADIYALGVLLYELLTGTTPLRKERLETAAWDEICRVIKEEEPQTPSVRLSTTEGRASIAARRQSDPARLGRFVRGDLDWIVMKALAKERDRRYATANALAMDLGRFLNHEPVLAGPPTVRYKVQKFLRRHRGPVVAASVVVLALAAGAVGTIWGLVATERRKAAQAEHEATLREERVRVALEKGLLAAMSADFATAEEAAIEADRAGALPPQIRMLRGLVAFSRGDMAEAVKNLELAKALLPDSAAVTGMLAYAYGYASDTAKFSLMLDQLKGLRAITPEDFLFKGLAESTLDAAQGLRTLKEVADRRPSAVVLLVRADVRTSYVQQVEPDPEQITAAIEDISAARKLENNAVAALRISLRTHLVATGVYKEARQHDAALKQAWRDFNSLGQHKNVPDVANIRYYFLREVGESDRALSDSGEVFALTKDPSAAYNHAQALYLKGKFKEAAKARREAGGRDLDWVLLLAVAENEGRELAYDLYRQMEEKGLADWDAYNGLLMLYALGYADNAKDKAAEFLRHAERFPVLRRDQFQAAIRFLAGELDEDRFLNQSGVNRADLSNIHLSIGLKCLADADRAGAAEQFQKTKDLWLIDFIPYDMSCLLLNRIDRAAKDGKKWPPWIGPKKPAGPELKQP